MSSYNKLFLIIAGLILVNVLSAWVFFRKDLTEENRYSISEASKRLVSHLPGPMEIEVYLGGVDLAGGFERLNKAVEESLDEYKNYGGADIS